MKRGALILHITWAVVALAAFLIGSKRGGPATGESARAATSKSAYRAAGLSGGAGGPESRTARSKGVREERDEKGGPVAEMYPAPALPKTEAEIRALAKEALQDGNPVVRRMAFTKLLEALTPENAAQIRSHLLEFRSDEGQWRDFHYAWGSIDGNAALKNAMDSPQYDMRFTMAGWAAANPNEARTFLETLGGDVKTDRELLKRGLVEGMADRDPDLATDLVYGLEKRGDKSANGLMSTVAGEVIQSMGREEAARWSESLPDGPLKGAAMDRVAHALVEKDPKAAAEWAAQYATADYGGRVIEEVGDEWAKRDPVKAVNWLESIDAGSGQRSGLTSAYNRWAMRDAVAAGERLASMPRSVERDAAISGFVRGFSTRDPAGAIEWANSISNTAVRTKSLAIAGQALYRVDPEGARAWLPASGLPADTQRAILNRK